MALLTLTESFAPASQARQAWRIADYLCWSRMQSEAGQQLDAIIERKERERQAGHGLFLWGVGNAPATPIGALVRMGLPVAVVFSIMKGKPKAIDVAPTRTVVWRRYIDARGGERPLPAGALVTSRGDSLGGTKKRHYALMCHSDVPLRVTRGIPFDPTAYRNAGGTGARVGASQVTALLRRVHEPSDYSEYEANVVAELAGSYWVGLTDPAELDAPALRAIAEFRGHRHWNDFVGDIMTSANSGRAGGESQPLLV